MRSLASGSTIIIIDSTASMSTRDEGARSRLERAKELARDMIAGLGGNDRAAVIESSSRVTVRSGLTADHEALNAGINDDRETDGAGKLADARSVSLQANDRAALIFDALPQAGGLAELKLNVEDDLASDNVAYAYLMDARRPRVAVISDNPFLLQAIAANDALDARKVS